MKYFILAVFAVVLIGLPGCTTQTYQDESVVHYEPIDVHTISEEYFMAEFSEIMYNYPEFIGRVIRYDGMFMPMYWHATSETFYYVARFGDSCCGQGGLIGFEVYLNNIPGVDEYTWVEITGVLEEYQIPDLGSILRLNAISMVELDEPREEFVGW